MKFLIIMLIITALLLVACSTAVSTTDGTQNANENTDEAATTPTIKSIYKISKNPKKFVSPNRDYLIVVNANYKYNFDGKYHENLQADLVFFPNIDGDIIAAEKATYLAFMLLQYDLWVNNGVQIGLRDGYRTAKDQAYLTKLYQEKEQLYITKLQEPGHSEHHTGLLLDVAIWYDDEWHSPTEESQEIIPEVKIFYEKMVDYGFIERYPSAKVNITGCKEKEHEIRFVGSPKIARLITKNDLCLEEYISN